MKTLKFAILALSIGSLSSCVTYKRCQEKFQTSNTVTDSVSLIVPVPFKVPIRQDSVIMVIKTETTPMHQEVQQGRAKLTFDRTAKDTKVKADCLSDTIFLNKQVKVKVPGERVIWGVDPWYKGAYHWMSVIAAISVFFNIIQFIIRKNKSETKVI